MIIYHGTDAESAFDIVKDHAVLSDFDKYMKLAPFEDVSNESIPKHLISKYHIKNDLEINTAKKLILQNGALHRSTLTVYLGSLELASKYTRGSKIGGVIFGFEFDKQELQPYYDLGEYDYPRKVSLDRLAEVHILGIQSSYYKWFWKHTVSTSDQILQNIKPYGTNAKIYNVSHINSTTLESLFGRLDD